MNSRKWFLIAASIILLISLCIIFPYEQSRSNFIDDLGYTFLTLAISMFLGMYGLMGKAFFKGLLFLIFSTVFSFCVWLLFYPADILSKIAAIYGGIPSGIVAGLFFLIVNHKFLKDENQYKQILKQLVCYSIILLIVSILFDKGGDWIDEILMHFKTL